MTLIVTQCSQRKQLNNMQRRIEATKKGRFQHLQLKMRKIQIHTFTVMKRTSWNIVKGLWKIPSKKGSTFCQSKNLTMDAETCIQQLIFSRCKRNHPDPLHRYTLNKKSNKNMIQTVDEGGKLKNNFAGFNNDLNCASTTGKQYLR